MKVISSLSIVNKGVKKRGLSCLRLVELLGCGGNRDAAKRPKMAAIAAKLSEKVILTSDNPEFLPYSVDAKDVLEAWEFVAFIGFPEKIDMNYILLDKLNVIYLNLLNLCLSFQLTLPYFAPFL